MGKCTVLVVDDEPMVRALLRRAIAAAEIDVMEADSAESALQVAERSTGFDLVITDILLGRMDGLELATRLVAAGSGSRFLFVSGYADEELIRRCVHQFEPALFLQKPFAIADLIHAVRHLLDSPPPRDLRANIRRSALQDAMEKLPVSKIRSRPAPVRFGNRCRCLFAQ